MVEIRNLSRNDLNLKYFKDVAARFLSEEGIKTEVSIVFINKESIKRLNQEYRDKDEPTDVLSFSGEIPGGNVLGEIFICPDKVKENADEYDEEFDVELKRMIIHGLLHLVGYDHKGREDAKKMKNKEDFYLKLI